MIDLLASLMLTFVIGGLCTFLVMAHRRGQRQDRRALVYAFLAIGFWFTHVVLGIALGVL